MKSVTKPNQQTGEFYSNALKSVLHQDGRLRVWSIIITIMGDVVAPIGGSIAIAELLNICRLLEIREQALRTAISRLAKEGWLVGERQGRASHYRFSEEGHSSYLAAAKNVYATPIDATDTNWIIGVLPPQGKSKRGILIDSLKQIQPLILNRQVIITSEPLFAKLPASITSQLLLFNKKPLLWPESLLANITPSPKLEFCQYLDSIAGQVADSEMRPEDALIIRILLIHFWRRLALRYPQITSPLSEEVWPLPRLHRSIATVYPCLLTKSKTALPGPQTDAFERFGLMQCH